MSQERKKVMIYLRPEAYANEKAASEKIKKHSDMARTALLAGLALGEVDSRLPGLLASLLTEDNNPELIRKCWHPSWNYQLRLRSALPPLSQ